MAHVAPVHGEKIIRIVSEHWIKYVFPAFLYVVLTGFSILLFILAGLTVHHSMWLSHLSFIAAFMVFLIAHHWFFTKLLGETMTHIVITNRRVVWIHESLFFREQMVEYAFEKMKTVAANKQGLLQNILRYGSLKFESGADVRLVPHPNRVAKDIDQAMGLK
jgi:hypothetical protein